MTKMKTFRLNTISRAELKVLSKFYGCSETEVIRIALQRLTDRLISNEEMNKAVTEMLTSEFRHDKSED